MSDRITGTHLQSEDLSDGAEKELERFGKWVEAGDFQALTDEIYKCRDKDRERKLEPVLKALNYKHIKFQIFRVVSRAYIEAGGAPAHLIPVRISGSGMVYDESTPAMELRIGQRVYFDKPIIVDGGMDFVLITAR